MREAEYQARLIKKLHKRFPGCVIHKNDPNYRQGLPDLVVYFYNTYAFLEVKISADADEQPNQRHYVDKFNDMAYASFIYPEIEDQVLREMQKAFSLSGLQEVL